MKKPNPTSSIHQQCVHISLIPAGTRDTAPGPPAGISPIEFEGADGLGVARSRYGQCLSFFEAERDIGSLYKESFLLLLLTVRVPGTPLFDH